MMKAFFAPAFAALVTFMTMSFVTTAMAADLCRAKALADAEDYYGNAPHQTSVSTINAGSAYHVSVGRGNAEDGEHYYIMTYPQGCTQAASITEFQN